MSVIITDLQKAECFTLLFQHIKLFTDHINITFEPERMYMQSTDSARISVFELTLPSTWFDTYELINNTPVTLGLQSSMIFKILNIRDKSQETHLNFNNDEDTLFVKFTCNNTAIFDKKFEMPLMDIDSELMEIPQQESDAEFSIASNTFANMVSQLKIFGDTMEFKCTEEKIELYAISQEAGKMLVDINIEDLTSYSINEGETMHLSFALTQMHNICMYNKISSEINIYLKKEFPLKLIYNIDEDAEFTFYLAPKIQD